MPVTLPDELLQSTKLTESELKAELALALFQREHLTLGQAALLAGQPQFDFQRLLASRQVPLHYGLDAMEEDLRRVAPDSRLSG
jgi:predicted HTH domain antitoxin